MKTEFADIDVVVAAKDCWEKCDDFDIEIESMYSGDMIFHRTFKCVHLNKCRRLLESLEKIEEVPNE